MARERSSGTGLDEDWEVILRHLPKGWEDKAFELGAMARSRGFRNPEALLRTLLIHLAQGCSLRETVVRAREGGIACVSDVALFKRLRASAEWLRWMAESLLGRASWVGVPDGGLRARAVDATVVSEPGSTGTDWRLHYAIDLKSLSCDHFELTDATGGESLLRVPISPGDLLIGDRAYGGAPGVKHALQAGGHVLIRLRLNGLRLATPGGLAFNLLHRAQRLEAGEIGEWPVCALGADEPIPGRVCALRKSRAAAAEAEKRLLKECSKKGKEPTPAAREAAKFVFLFTTVPAQILPRWDVCELYRARWQIELAFKRMKSIMALGHLPKHDPESCRAWLHGKLVVALLLERIVESAHAFSPWGYRAA
jgi:hypothetical protein